MMMMRLVMAGIRAWQVRSGKSPLSHDSTQETRTCLYLPSSNLVLIKLSTKTE